MVETDKRGLKVVVTKDKTKSQPDDDAPQLWNCIREGKRPLDEFRFSQFEILEFRDLVEEAPDQTIKLA